MLGPRVGNNPDSDLRAKRSDVGYYLSEMVVIALLKLIFDYNGIPAVIFGNQIDIEISGRMLSFGILQRNTDDIRQDISILDEPRREIPRLIFPHLSKRQAFYFTDHNREGPLLGCTERAALAIGPPK